MRAERDVRESEIKAGVIMNAIGELNGQWDKGEKPPTRERVYVTQKK
jgi:hypothetical protein